MRAMAGDGGGGPRAAWNCAAWLQDRGLLQDEEIYMGRTLPIDGTPSRSMTNRR